INAAYTDITRETISDFSTLHEAKSYVVDAFNKYVFNKQFHTIIGLNYANYESVFAEEESFNNTDPYLNVVYVSDFGLNLNAGARLNNHSEYGSHFVYSFNPSYSLQLKSGYAKIFGSYATSFIAPNLSQLFGFFGANPNLEPEENLTKEIGLEFANTKGLRLSGLYFNRNEGNTIIYTTAYENAINDATVQGVEVEAFYTGVKDLIISANCTFAELKEGIRLRLPKHKINANVGFNFSKETYASLGYQFIGSRTDTDFSTSQDITLKSFSLVDFYFSHKLIKNKLKLFVNATNLLNEDYTEIIGFTTKGRNMSLGMNLNF